MEFVGFYDFGTMVPKKRTKYSIRIQQRFNRCITCKSANTVQSLVFGRILYLFSPASSIIPLLAKRPCLRYPPNTCKYLYYSFFLVLVGLIFEYTQHYIVNIKHGTGQEHNILFLKADLISEILDERNLDLNSYKLLKKKHHHYDGASFLSMIFNFQKPTDFHVLLLQLLLLFSQLFVEFFAEIV